MNYLTKEDWNKKFLQKFKDDNSFIKQFKSMAKIHNNLLYLLQKFNQNEKNITIKEKTHLINIQQRVFITSLIFYHKYNFKEDLLSQELPPSEQILIYAGCIFLALKFFHLPKNIELFSKIIQPYIIIESKKLEINEIKDLISKKEFDILLSIEFDTGIDLPYNFIYKFKKYLEKINETNSKIEELIKLLLIYINDSLIFPLYLYYTPNVIVLSCILLIKEKLKIDEINIDDLILLSTYKIDIDSIRECSLLIKKIILTKDNLAKAKTANIFESQNKNFDDNKDIQSKNTIADILSSIKTNTD